MSTTTIPSSFHTADDDQTSRQSFIEVVTPVLRPLASMKLTIVLFALSMFIVFVGSLAQSRRDVWLVMGDYFRTFLAWIDLADLFPPSMFPQLGDYDWSRLGAFRYIPFPGGWLIGTVMLMNLTAAHLLRFKVRVSGTRLSAAIVVLALGAALTSVVIYTGNVQTGVETGNFILTDNQLWYTVLAVMGVSGGL
ncbi:MAG: hypothetical protein KDA91_10275, partial [Planctomycetaceae bacterium]|nr:hypothetical protein [Planctomycetaceae bacterium]